MWKEDFKSLLGNSSKVKGELIIKITYNQLDIHLGQFTQEELNVVLTKIKSRKSVSVNEMLLDLWKTKKFIYITRTQSKNKQMATSSPSLRSQPRNHQDIQRHYIHFYSGQVL